MSADQMTVTPADFARAIEMARQRHESRVVAVADPFDGLARAWKAGGCTGIHAALLALPTDQRIPARLWSIAMACAVSSDARVRTAGRAVCARQARRPVVQ